MNDQNITDFLHSLKDIDSNKRLKIFQEYLKLLAPEQVQRAETLFSFMNSIGSIPPSPKKIVVLIHGIRTFASWQGVVEKALEDQKNIEVVKIKYFYFDLIRFLSPIITREKPIERVLRELRDIRSRNQTAELIVIAHSFGSYIINNILQKDRSITISRLILCGSIVKEDFDWGSLPNIPDIIVNDVGLKDKLPLLAKLASWGYGISGSYGFGTYFVKDRYHDLGHSDFFNKENGIINKYWMPFLLNGQIVKTELDSEQPTPNGILALLSSLPQGTIVYTLLAITTYCYLKFF